MIEAMCVLAFLFCFAFAMLSMVGVTSRMLPKEWKVAMISHRYGLSKQYVRRHLHEYGE